MKGSDTVFAGSGDDIIKLMSHKEIDQFILSNQDIGTNPGYDAGAKFIQLKDTVSGDILNLHGFEYFQIYQYDNENQTIINDQLFSFKNLLARFAPASEVIEWHAAYPDDSHQSTVLVYERQSDGGISVMSFTDRDGASPNIKEAIDWHHENNRFGDVDYDKAYIINKDTWTSYASLIDHIRDEWTWTDMLEISQAILDDVNPSDLYADILSSLSDVSLTVGEADSGRFGNKWSGRSDSDGVVTASFDVSDPAQDLVLSLTGYDIDFNDEVSVSLNGDRIGYLDKGVNLGTSSHQMKLSSSDLVSGQNDLSFEVKYASWAWGVGDLEVSEAGASVSDVSLTVGEADSGRFGNKWSGRSDSDGVVTASFDVSDPAQDLVLSLTGYDIDFNDEVSVSLNGDRIGYLDKGVNLGTSSHQMKLSSSRPCIRTE